MLICQHIAYSSVTDIRDEAGFTEFDNVTHAQVTPAQTKADSEINGVRGSVEFTLPLNVTVPLLTTNSQVLAAGHLLTRAFGSGAEGTNKDGAALKEDARDMLKLIGSGSMQLVDSDGTVLINTTNSSGSDLDSIEGAARDPSSRMDHVF